MAQAAGDPYRNYHFRILWDGKAVAGFTEVSGLCGSAETVRHRGGGDPGTDRPVPGKSRSAAITLKRGISCDVAFARWATLLCLREDGARPDFHKEIRIELMDEAGGVALAWDVHRCWPSKFAGPQLNAKGTDVAIEELVLDHEGVEIAPAP